MQYLVSVSQFVSIPATQYEPDRYDELLAIKCREVIEKFKPFNLPCADIFPSPKSHFRMRAEFRIWHENISGKDRCFYAMFKPHEPKIPIEVSSFPLACSAIEQLMQPLLQRINRTPLLHRKLFQIELLSSTHNQVVVSLIYHRQLDEKWLQTAAALERELSIAIIGRARKQKIVLSRDFVMESLCVDGVTFNYEQKENSFTQPNAVINQNMVAWCDNYLSTQSSSRENDEGLSDMIEMYCGNGNFTIPLSRHFRRVLATEISKSSIASAKKNCALNNIENIDFVRLSGEETSLALGRVRAFRRLKHIDLDSYRFSTVFVDPPRAGLDDNTLNFIQRFKRIIYISCNPDTLAKNMSTLTQSHRVARFALFDQFPYTPHCECGLILESN